MQELLAIIARGLVDAPEAVKVDRDEPNDQGDSYHCAFRLYPHG